METFRVHARLEVWVSYDLKAENEQEAIDNEKAQIHVVALDSSGNGLGVKGALHGSVKFHIEGCCLEPESAEKITGDP